MSSPLSATFPYHDHTFRTRCEKCQQCNQVEVTKQDGHNESEEYFCANCGHLLGTARASKTPSVMIVIDNDYDEPSAEHGDGDTGDR